MAEVERISISICVGCEGKVLRKAMVVQSLLSHECVIMVRDEWHPNLHIYFFLVVYEESTIQNMTLSALDQHAG